MSLYQRGMSLKDLLENPDLLNPPRKQADGVKNKEGSLDGFDGSLFAGQSAFLGPQLWEKTVSYDEADLKLEFMDLDELLSENSVSGSAGQPPVSPSAPQPSSPLVTDLGALLTDIHDTPLPQLSPSQPQLSPSQPQLSPAQPQLSPAQPQLSPSQPQFSPSQPQLSPLPPMIMIDPNDLQNSPQVSPQVSPQLPMAPVDAHARSSPEQEDDSDCEDFDPRNRIFTEEELRPQPVLKKSRKVFVPDDMKDDKYWARRKKNNVAARRSRDARRTKENQIAMRALFLEQQSEKLAQEVQILRQENAGLRTRLAKYEPEAANTS